jgi:hypothetical protein
MEDREQIAAKASGAWPRPEVTVGCPYNVGDFISFPDFPTQFYQVAMRYYRQGATADESQWLVKLEHVANPFEVPPGAPRD